MSVVVVNPRADVALIDLELVKKHLRVDHGDDDDLIQLYQSAVEGWLDGPAGWLGRALGPQTLRARRTVSGAKPLTLDCRPVSAVNSVSWIDPAGIETTMAEDAYVVDGDLIRSADEADWPGVELLVKYEAGYAAGAVPRPIQAAMLLLIGDLYASRETGVVGTVAADVKMTATASRLLAPYRVWVS